MDHFRGRLHTIRSHSLSTMEDESGQVNAAKTPADAPAHEHIASLAYSHWEARGRQGGSALEDWFRAEREMKERK